LRFGLMVSFLALFRPSRSCRVPRQPLDAPENLPQ
jgi:hypothetical protein